MKFFMAGKKKREDFFCCFPGLLQGNPLALRGKMDEGVVGEPGSWQIRCCPLPHYPSHLMLKLVPTSTYSE